MKDKVVTRLAELKAQFEEGSQRLEDMEAKAHSLRETLLRISGAIQVLEETLADGSETDKEAGKTSGR